jgi:hypothetical protein
MRQRLAEKAESKAYKRQSEVLVETGEDSDLEGNKGSKSLRDILERWLISRTQQAG